MTSNAQTLSIFESDEASSEDSPAEAQIDRRENLSREEFLREYVLKNRPVILTDAAKDWNAIGKWSPEFFADNFGSKVVPVNERTRRVVAKGRVTLREYVDEMASSTRQNPARYLFSLQIPTTFPELMHDLEPHPSYWYPNWLESKYLLPGLPNFKLRHITGLEMNMGGAGSPFPFLHYDDLWTQTFITQVYGRKKWVLYSPDQAPYMYPLEDSDNISQIPMEHDVDLSEFPLFANARPVEFVLEQGETLYGAPGWWHTTQALTSSIAVVLSTANGPIWGHVTKAAFRRAWEDRRWYVKSAAIPIVCYMAAFGAVKSVIDRY